MIDKLILTIALLITSPMTLANTVPNEEFKYVCAYADIMYGVECGDLKAPTVVTSKILSWPFKGLYIRGEEYVFVGAWVPEEERLEAQVHETMHYVLDHANSGFDRCESEAAARHVGAVWSGIKYSDDWQELYKCAK